mmetsp:Transcript_4617/g.9250  ORF Transcript_4617/g.9250 Transcript_4617/m.9250 type:complete len:94 (+) Transcript_4617:5655-5936(+)
MARCKRLFPDWVLTKIGITILQGLDSNQIPLREDKKMDGSPRATIAYDCHLLILRQFGSALSPKSSDESYWSNLIDYVRVGKKLSPSECIDYT